VRLRYNNTLTITWCIGLSLCRGELATSSCLQVSHAHTVVWQCCKDDRRSQWGMTKFDPQPTPLNRSSPNLKHVITSEISSSKKIWAQSAQGILPPHTWNIHPKPSNVHFFFSQFFRKSTDALVGRIFTFNASYDVVLRKVVPFGGEKI